MHKVKNEFARNLLFLLRATQLRWKALISKMLLITLLSAAIEILNLSLVYPFLFLLLQGNDFSQYPSLVAQIFTILGVDTLPHFQLVLWLGVGIVFITLGRGVFSFFSKIYLRKKAFTMENALRNHLFEIYLYASFRKSNQKDAVDIISILVNDPRGFSGFVYNLIVTISTSFIILGTIGFFSLINPYVILLMVLFILIIVVLYQSVKTKSVLYGERLMKTGRESLQYLHQGVWNLPITKIQGAESYFLFHFFRFNDEMIQNSLGVERLSILPRSVTETALIVSMVIFLLLYVILGGDSDSLFATAGTLVIAIFRILPMAMGISAFFQGMGAVKPVIKRASDFKRNLGSPMYDTASGAKKLHLSHLQVKDISFSYNGVHDVLSHIDLTIQRGEFLGIIGRSGSGKTTLLHLLLGLYPVQRGEFSVNGSPVAQCMPSWQKTIGYVPQSIFLLEGSIKKNIAFGIHDEDIDPILLDRSIRMAHLNEFIDSLPKGEETPLSESGKNISGGQRQRIGIARALYHQPEVLVFDEATNSLDAETEKGLLDDVRGLVKSQGLTVIMVAHYHRALAVCSRIVKITHGVMEHVEG